jgi:fatty acid-binding protein DegV
MLERSLDAESTPVSAEEMSRILEKELVLKYDQVLAITITYGRSKIFENIRDAVWVSQPKFKELRRAVGVDRRFRIQVLDSTNMFTGQAVLTYEAVRLLKEENASVEKIVMALDSLKHRVRAFLVPQDLYHLKNRAGNRGEKSDNSLNWLTYQVGTMLNIKPIVMANQGVTSPVDKAIGFESGLEKIFANAMTAIDKGLSINVVCMSYAGELADIEKQSAYKKFVSYCHRKHVPTTLCVMSTTAAVNVGPGCFCLAYAGPE